VRRGPGTGGDIGGGFGIVEEAGDVGVACGHGCVWLIGRVIGRLIGRLIDWLVG
jgi:hypothetical protein